MMASALKMIGIPPEVLEGISKGLLQDLKMVVAQQQELLDRQEFSMREDGDWETYLRWKAERDDRRYSDFNAGTGTLNGPGPGS